MHRHQGLECRDAEPMQGTHLSRRPSQTSQAVTLVENVQVFEVAIMTTVPGGYDPGPVCQAAA